MKSLLLCLLLVMGSAHVLAEDVFQNPDKVYLHLDRHLYAQGDTVWIKGYALHRGNNTPSDNSYALHVQMLDERGKEVHSYKMLIVDGMAQGQIHISSVLAPGFYQLIAHTGYMKNFDQRFFYKTTIEVRKPFRHSTMSVLFDKSAYQVGETAMVTFTMLNKNKVPIGGGRFVCDYLEGDEPPKRKSLHCYDDGTVTVPFYITAGSYAQMPMLELSYYETPGDEHPLTQEVYVPMYNDEIHLDFYPEGGDLIQGINSKVAFKATDVRGAQLDVTFDVFEDGKKICSASSMHEGMGMCTFLPKQAEYTVKITSSQGGETIYDFPKVKDRGYNLSLLSQTEESVRLRVSQNYGMIKSCQLWISHCDSLWGVKSFVVEGTHQLVISKADLPHGIVTFTLSDENNKPQAERLVYVDSDVSSLSIDLAQSVFESRQKVDFSLALDRPKVAQLSFAVVDSTYANSPNLSSATIKAYAELESELKGRINNPNQYLGHSRSVANKRDLLLLTHGWRRFEWIDNEKVLSHLKVHDFNRVVGQVTRLKRPYANAKMSAFMLGKTVVSTEFEADEQGRFYIDPIYESRIDQNILIMSRSRRGNKGVTLKLTVTDTLLFSSVIQNNKYNLLPVLHTNDFTNRDKQSTTVEQPFMSYESILLNEFEVSADKKELGMSDYFKVADDVALGKDLKEASSFYWLLSQFSNRIDGNVSGFEGVYKKDEANMGLQDNNETDGMDRIRIATYDCLDRKDVIYLPDGGCVSIYKEDLSLIFDEINTPAAMIYVNGEPWGYEAAPLSYLKTSDIASIAIMDGAKGYDHFGIEAYYGAIIVETYDKNIVDQYKLHLSHAIFGNFINARQFAKTRYDIKGKSNTLGDDNRVTLHWEPLLETDENGQAKVSFYTGDIPGKKQIIVQGFDDEGNLYYETVSFMVKDILKR